MLRKSIVLIIAFVLFMSLASAESGLIDTGDTLTADLDNGAYIFVPGYFEFTNLSITTGQLQFWLNDSQIQWRTNTNKTLTNITFNTAIDNLSFNANGTDGYLNFSGMMNNGSYNYSFYLDSVFQSYVESDGDGVITVNYTGAWSDHQFVVIPTISNTAPTLTGIPDKNTNEDTDLLNTFDLDDYYFDADSDTPTFSVQSNNQSGSVTVDINAGNTVDFHLAANWYGVAEIVFNVSDGNGGTANDTMILTVASVNDNPVLEYIGPKNINELEELIIDLESTDVDGDTPEYSCNRTDLFTDFDNVSGIGTWTPNSTQAGVYNVIFTVQDGNGGSDFEVVVITVNDIGITIDSTWNTTKISTGSTNSTSIKLPLEATGTYDFTVDWGDGNSSYVTAYDQANVTHTYASEGSYDLSISGTITGWRFNNVGDKLKLTDISNWGSLNLGNSNGYFFGCQNFNATATDALDLTGTTDMSYAFLGAYVFNYNTSAWDVSNITKMTGMFFNAYHFNQDISSWDVSIVTDMENMFRGAHDFNQDISSWDVSQVTIMSYMFSSAVVFNQDISSWDVSKVTNMEGMFFGAEVFNQDINIWDVSSVTTMVGTFDSAYVFNQPLNSWDVSSVTTMCSMFGGAPIFNQPLDSWDVSNVIDMSSMFSGADAFNQNIGGWNTSSVEDMRYMFYGADAFNQDIGGWNTSSVENMRQMFYGADIFDQNIGSWNISSLSDATGMFSGVTLSTANYDSLLIGWAGQAPYIQSNVPFHGGNSQYSCDAVTARNTTLISTYSWTITDGGLYGVCDACSVTNISGVWEFNNCSNIPSLHAAVGDESVLEYNVSQDIYTFYEPFWQNQSTYTFFFNETVHLKSNVDSTPADLVWSGTVIIDNSTILGWNTTSDSVATAQDNTRAFLYINSGGYVTGGNITNSNLSYLGYSGFSGVQLFRFVSQTIDNNTFSNNYNGVIFESSNNIIFTNNIMHSNTRSGILTWASDSDNFTISDNIAYNNGYHGFYIYSTPDSTITDNAAYLNSRNGFYIDTNSDNSNLTNNSAYSNTYDGIVIEASTDNILINNSVYSNTLNGIYVYLNSNNNKLINNNVTNTTAGYYDYNFDNNAENNIVTLAVKVSNSFRIDDTVELVYFTDTINYTIGFPVVNTVIQDNPPIGTESVNITVISGTIDWINVTAGLDATTDYSSYYSVNDTEIEQQTTDGAGIANFTVNLLTGTYYINESAAAPPCGCNVSNISGVWEFNNCSDIPTLHTAVGDEAVLEYNVSEDIYTFHEPFYQNLSTCTFYFNETVHLKSNVDSNPAYFKWAGTNTIDYSTVLGWNTTSNSVATTVDDTRAWMYGEPGASGNITNSNLSYLGYNTYSDESGFCINGTSYSVIQNNTFSYNKYGLFVFNSTVIDILDNVFDTNYMGLYLSESSNSNIINNTVYTTYWYGIYIYDSSNINTSDNWIQDSSSYGMYLHTVIDSTIHNNDLYSGDSSGVFVQHSENNSYTDNRAYSNLYNGFHFQSGNENLTNNTAYSNGYNGYWFDWADDIILTNNTAYSNGRHGFLMRASDNTWSINNNVSDTAGGCYDYRFEVSSINNTVTLDTKVSNTFRVDDTIKSIQFTDTTNYTIGFPLVYSTIQDNPPIGTENANVTVISGTIDWINITSGLTPDTNYSSYYSINDTLIETQTTDGSGIANFTINFTTGTYYINESTTAPQNEYIPPDPINLANTTGNFYVNFTWQAGSGNVTDSFNVSQNGTWVNGSLTAFNNSTVPPHGTSTIIVYAYNSSNNGTLSTGYVTDSVTVPNNAPTLTGLPNTNTNEDTDVIGAFDLDDYYSDADGDSPTYQVQSNDQSANVTVTINGDNTVDYILATDWHGVANIVFNVSDGYTGTDTDAIILTVSSINDCPVLDPIGAINEHENETVIVDVDATDPDFDTLTYACNRTDLFTDFNTNGGITTWTTNYSSAGVYYVNFSVDDGNGCEDYEIVIITITDTLFNIDSYWNNITGESLSLSAITGSTVDFGVTTSITADDISWYIGSTFLENDSATSQGNLTYQFNSNGIFEINVSAVNGSAWTGNTTFTVTILPPVNISGYVFNRLELPIENARLDINDVYVYTNVTGYYEFSDIISGLNDITIRAIFYGNRYDTINMTNDSVSNYTLNEKTCPSTVPGFGFITNLIIILIVALRIKKTNTNLKK